MLRSFHCVLFLGILSCASGQEDFGGCTYGELQFKDGDIWISDCQNCTCFENVISCSFIEDCLECLQDRSSEDEVYCATISCATTCSTCRGSDTNICLRCAADDQTPVNGTCQVTCSSYCDLCENGVCQICAAGRELVDGACACPEGSYDEGEMCHRCHSSCTTCSGPESTECLSCHTGELKEGKCQEKHSCLDQQHWDPKEQSCKACHSSCASCQYSDKHGGSVRCDTCKDRTRLVQGHRCVRQCDSGWFQDGDSCKKCHVTCGECVYTGAKGCQSCRRGLFLTQFGTCEPECTVGYYPSQGLCLPCDAGCTTCDKNGKCVAEYQSDQSKAFETPREISITVIESQNTVLLSDHFDFAPHNIDPKKVVYHIIQPFNTEDGVLINIDRPGQNLAKFTQNDLLKTRIVFTPTRLANGQAVTFSSIFTVSHPEKKKNKKRDVEHKLVVRLVPGSESESRFVEPFPRVYVEQGGTTHLPADYFRLSGTDVSASDQEMTITDMPQHGFLTQIFEAGENFTQESLQLGDFISFDELVYSTLLYQHDGSSNLDDSFEVTVSDGESEAVNRILFVVFPANDEFHVQSAAALQETNTAHSLRILEGESIILPHFDSSTSTSEPPKESGLTYLLTVEPHYGTLYRLTGTATQKIETSQSFTGEDVMEGRILYAADTEIGPQPVQETIKLSITSENGDGPKEVEIIITIGPVDSQPPQVTVNSDLTVDEGRKEILSPDIVSVEDVDSPISQLEIRIDSGPSFGYIVQRNVGDTGAVEARSSSFPVQALLDEQLVYVQNDHMGKEPTEDSFLFHVTDGTKSSPTLKLNIHIEMVNDEPPVVVTEPLFSEVGGSAVIGNETFFVSDLDTDPSDLLITVVQAPKFGTLQRQDSRYSDSFTILSEGGSLAYSDFLDHYVTYSHTGQSEIQRADFMSFKVSDGDFSTDAQLQVTIGSIDKNLPSLRNNKGVLLPIGSHRQLTNTSLLATSDNPGDIMYTITRVSPNVAVEVFVNDRWTKVAEVSSGAFNQSEISGGRVRVSVSKSETFMEFFFFEVTDEKGATLTDQTFVIEVMINDPPFVVRDRKLSLEAGERRVLTNEFVTATDSDNEPDDLLYEVKGIPRSLRIAHVEYPDLDVYQWAQTDLNNRKIEVHGVAAGQETLKIILTDGFNQVDADITIVVKAVEQSTTQPETEPTLIGFGVEEITVKENATIIRIPVTRSGNKIGRASAICYTVGKSADENDFVPRPLEEGSRIFFLKGVETVTCDLEINDDTFFEKEEVLEVVLVAAEAESGIRLLTERAAVKIVDPEDKPRLKFEKMTHTVVEPNLNDIRKPYSLKLMRIGDTSKPLQAKVTTVDASAVDKTDFLLLTRDIRFQPGETVASIDFEILYNSDNSWHRSFNINVDSQGTSAKASITITPQRNSALTILPAEPIVISLIHFDNITEGFGEEVSAGYPLICITACDPKYPNYNKTSDLCRKTNVGMTRYTWEVAQPPFDPMVISPFYEITESTLFTDARDRILDPIYFNKEFKVRCVNQPIMDGGLLGAPITSKPVKISSNPTCSRKGPPFKALVNISDDRIVHMKVEVPFKDGSIPLISTMPLYSVRYLLTESIYRTQHICSNLHPAFGFLSDTGISAATREGILTGNLRSESSVRLYKHLNLKSCLWTFEAKFSLSDLVNKCGGKLTSVHKVDSAGRDRIVIRVPLFISNIEAAPPYGWSTTEHSTELEVGLQYDPVLWHKGLQTNPALATKPQVTRVASDPEGRLVVELRTHASFSGFYVTNDRLGKISAGLISPPAVTTPFNLSLAWTKNTIGGVEQSWRAVSQYSLNDYSGDYQLRLVPCVFNQDLTQSPERCDPQEPISLPVSVAFKHTHRTVPAIYSLNTEFTVSKDSNILVENLSDGTTEIQTTEEKFSRGDSIYGRVRWYPSNGLDTSYTLRIQRVYICAGKDGYIPSYDPSGSVYKEGPQFGCLENSPKLQYRLLLLDREEPRAADRIFQDMPIEAFFASSHPDFTGSVTFRSGLDGFVMKVDPLYQAKSGNVWFIQVIYTIAASYSRNRRDLNEGGDVVRQGTNIRCIRLVPPDHSFWINAGIVLTLIPVLGGLTLGLTGFIIYRSKKRRKRLEISDEEKTVPECRPLNESCELSEVEAAYLKGTEV